MWAMPIAAVMCASLLSAPFACEVKADKASTMIQACIVHTDACQHTQSLLQQVLLHCQSEAYLEYGLNLDLICPCLNCFVKRLSLVQNRRMSGMSNSTIASLSRPRLQKRHSHDVVV